MAVCAAESGPVLRHRGRGLLSEAMQPNVPAGLESSGIDCGIDPDRLARALTECMTVYDEGGDMFSVSTQSGAEYTVDAREGRCTCRDAQYNLAPDEACKHELRVRVCLGAVPIPAWAQPDAIDDHLGEHVDGEPRQAATDGVTQTVAGLGEDVDLDAADCDCESLPDGLPCFSCYVAGEKEYTYNDR